VNVSKIFDAYVKQLRVEPAMVLFLLYKPSSEHEISFGIKCPVYVYIYIYIYTGVFTFRVLK
jgi:hypothetical protein